MPFRERMKKVFKPSPSSNTATSTTAKGPAEPAKDPDIFQPDEMPRLKYRRPADPETTEKLEAFSFGNMFRRKSAQMSYSPMGSRSPSRRNSAWSLGRRSNKSRAASRLGPTDVAMSEGEDEEGDVGNVALSRQVTRDKPRPVPADADPSRHETHSEITGPQGVTINGHAYSQNPFRADELAEALRKTQLQAPTGGAPIVR